MALQLYIGNKNYSSWSMRPWVLMRELGIAFDEVALRFDFSEGSAFRQAVARVSPARRVPVLLDDGFAVWDTLAIAEYLHEKFPDAGVWPQGATAKRRPEATNGALASRSPTCAPRAASAAVKPGNNDSITSVVHGAAAPPGTHEAANSLHRRGTECRRGSQS